MAKFLNKKEQVIDFQLTPYGNYLLSTGVFKPAYYAFYDSNILYDKRYARGTYCKSASCGAQEITEVKFINDTKAYYSPMTTDAFGNKVPTEYLTIYNGTTPYNFWFKTINTDREPGTGVVGTKPMIDLMLGTFPDKEAIAKAFWSQIHNGPWPFTATYAAGQEDVYVTAIAKGPSTDVSQTMSANVLTGSVYLQGTALESFRAISDVPVENQNDIHERIKSGTQYFEGLTTFSDLESNSMRKKDGLPLTATPAEATELQFEYDLTAIRERPEKDIFKFDSAIGDAMFDSNKKQHAPAWKIVTLSGHISGSSIKDIKNQQLIPQIDMDMIYSKEIKNSTFMFQSDTIADTIDSTSITKEFSDGYKIMLNSEDIVIYTEEQNTSLLTENFDIEVYEILAGAHDSHGDLERGSERLIRRFFQGQSPQIIDGMMVRETINDSLTSNRGYATSSVEYYFDLYTDTNVNKKIACQGADIFNKESYYVDIDFDCENRQSEDIYFDIYGRATDPEICQT